MQKTKNAARPGGSSLFEAFGIRRRNHRNAGVAAVGGAVTSYQANPPQNSSCFVNNQHLVIEQHRPEAIGTPAATQERSPHANAAHNWTTEHRRSLQFRSCQTASRHHKSAGSVAMEAPHNTSVRQSKPSDDRAAVVVRRIIRPTYGFSRSAKNVIDTREWHEIADCMGVFFL